MKTAVRVQSISPDDKTRLAELAIAATVSRMLRDGSRNIREQTRAAKRETEFRLPE